MKKKALGSSLLICFTEDGNSKVVINDTVQCNSEWQSAAGNPLSFAEWIHSIRYLFQSYQLKLKQ